MRAEGRPRSAVGSPRRFCLAGGAVGLAASTLAAGCSLRLTLLADSDTNQGRPLQVIVRSVDEGTYRTDSYSAAAQLVTASDGSLLRQLALDPRPNLRRSFRIKPPPGRPVALYFLYTAPTGSWKMLLLPPLPYAVTVPLRRHGIAVEGVTERRLRSPDSAPAGRPTPASAGESRPPPASSPMVPTVPAVPSVPVAPSIPLVPAIPAAPSVPVAPSIPVPVPVPVPPLPPTCPCPLLPGPGPRV